MPRTLGFSPRVYEAVSRFYREHPVFELEQHREIVVEGPGGELVNCTRAVCTKCGFSLKPQDNPMLSQGKQWPADTFKAVTLRHAWDLRGRSTYCGGTFTFELGS